MKYAVIIIIAVLFSMSINLSIAYVRDKNANVKKELTNKVIYILAVGYAVILISGIVFFKIPIIKLKYIHLIISIGFLGIIDFKYKLVMNVLLLLFIIIQLLFYVIEFDKSVFVMNLIYGVTAFLILSTVERLFKDKFGMGDVKLLAVTAFSTGIGGMINILFVAMFAAFAVSIILMIARKITLKGELPFVPFIFVGTIIESISYIIG